MKKPIPLPYSGFWSRLSAGIIDLYLIFILEWVTGKIGFYQHIPYCYFYVIYCLVMHRFYGATVGKLIIGVKVVSLDGGKLTWNQSLYRSLIDLCFALFFNYSLVFAEMVHNPKWFNMDFALYVSLHQWIFIGKIYFWAMIWNLSEYGTLLFHPQRRSFHDLLAKTVVIYRDGEEGSIDH